jgi:glycosyltransferase involved in cell wall biosynthesis
MPIMPKIAGGETSDYDLTSDITSNMGKLDRNAPAICFWYPPMFDEVLGVYPKNIGYFIFEYTDIPKEWVDNMNQLDVVCTASKWGVEVLKKNGVTTKCVVVPGGVDTKIFYPANEKRNDGVTRFIHVGKAETRKGTIELLQAFNKTFKGDRSVELTILIDNGNITSKSFLNKCVEEKLLIHPVDNIHPLSFIPDLASLYRQHDCGVFPSKAEGIGLPITEAMACGLPVISSNYSGMSEYMNEENAILLKNNSIAKIYDPKYFPVAGERGTWAMPSIDEIGEKMLWVKNNIEEARKIGFRASEDMKKYSWEAAGKKFIDEVLNAEP